MAADRRPCGPAVRPATAGPMRDADGAHDLAAAASDAVASCAVEILDRRQDRPGRTQLDPAGAAARELDGAGSEQYGGLGLTAGGGVAGRRPRAQHSDEVFGDHRLHGLFERRVRRVGLRGASWGGCAPEQDGPARRPPAAGRGDPDGLGGTRTARPDRPAAEGSGPALCARRRRRSRVRPSRPPTRRAAA